jgi:hypothetical protein
MLDSMVRHVAVGAALAVTWGIATAHSLGYVGGPAGNGYIEYMETRPVLRGDLGEVVVTATKLDAAARP